MLGTCEVPKYYGESDTNKKVLDKHQILNVGV